MPYAGKRPEEKKSYFASVKKRLQKRGDHNRSGSDGLFILRRARAVAVPQSRILGQGTLRGLELWKNRRLAILSSGKLADSQS